MQGQMSTGNEPARWQCFARPARDAALHGAGLVAVLAAVLGLLVVLGAHLSPAFPSAQKPFGWPGPTHFENGVAMVRAELALAGSLVPLILGAMLARRLDPRRDNVADLLLAAASGLLLL